MEVLLAISAITDPILKQKVDKSLALLRRTFALYAPSAVALSFNGGKDSTVLLHLVRAALAQWLQQQQTVEVPLAPTAPPAATPDSNGRAANGVAVPANGAAAEHRVRSFFFERDDDFEEIVEFVRRTDERYSLCTDVLVEKDFKAGLQSYLAATGVRAIVLGTRRGDPNAGDQEHFCPSSDGWPPFMRVNPIMDWTYHDVWGFLRAAGVQYCRLYDEGYTSLGSRFNTTPNAALKHADGSFAPAHSLLDGRLERAGRASKASPDAAALRESVASAETPSAALLMIGDEILSGKVQDTNASFLCSELRSIGWQVRRLATVPDDVAAIAAELTDMSDKYDVVITSGGVGPTLDDVTMEGVAAALGAQLVRHPNLERRLLEYFGQAATAAHLKMAQTPDQECELIDMAGEDDRPSAFPLVRCRNIFVLPGVPHLVKRKWEAIRQRLQQQVRPKPFHSRVFRLSVGSGGPPDATPDEAHIAPMLDELAAQVKDVSLGSYPVSGQCDGANVLLALEGKDEARLQEAADLLAVLLPPGCVLSVERDQKMLLRVSSPRDSTQQ